MDARQHSLLKCSTSLSARGVGWGGGKAPGGSRGSAGGAPERPNYSKFGYKKRNPSRFMAQIRCREQRYPNGISSQTRHPFKFAPELFILLLGSHELGSFFLTRGAKKDQFSHFEF